MTEKLRIGWLSFHREGLAALETLVKTGESIVAVITLEEELRVRRSGAIDYGPFCKAHNIVLHTIRDINDESALALLDSLALDVLFVIGWSQILQERALSVARFGCYGAHASLLPHNRGSAPVNWAIIRGETSTGNTLMKLAPNIDAGDIVDQDSIPISPYDDSASVYDAVAHLNTRMVVRLVRALARGESPGKTQPSTTEAILPRRRPEHGVVDWRWDALKVYNLIRGVSRPYPGAFGRLEGDRWTIWQSACLPLQSRLALPGTCLGAVVSPLDGACGQLVACGTGALILLELESELGQSFNGRALAALELTGKTWNIESNELDTC